MNDALARLKFLAEVNKIVEGKRGWISLTAFIRENGSNREQLTKIAEKHGLKVGSHGKYGITASKAR